MPTDPKYVRLNDYMSSQTIADIQGGSGWSISGAEVAPFPKEEDAARYVRQQLAVGILEAASKAELDEQKRVSAEYEAAVAEAPDQEQAIQSAAAAAQQGNADTAETEASSAEGEGEAE